MRDKFLAAIFITTAIYLLILPLTGYFYTSRIIKDKLVTLTDQNLEQIASSINHVIDDMIIASNVIVLDEAIIDLLLDKEKAVYHKMRQVESKLRVVEAGNLYPYNVETTLIDFHGNIYTTGDIKRYDYDQVIQETWYQEALESKGHFKWLAPTDTYFKAYTNADGMTLVRLVRKGYYQTCGIMILHVYNEKKVKHLLESEQALEGTHKLLLNQEGDVILHTGQLQDVQAYANGLKNDLNNNQQHVTIDGIDKIMLTHPIAKTDWHLIETVPYGSVMAEEINYRNFTIAINVIFLVVIVVLAFFISEHFSKSIGNLSRLMHRVQQGDFSVKSNVTGSYEVNMLSDSFNAMVDKIDDLIKTIKEESELRQQVKLEALQAQINPHFLLNTLNGIKWLCVIEEAKTAEKMLLDLGILLEGILGKFNEFITIEDEVKCLQSYVRLQKMRYGSLFDVLYHVPEKYKHIKIPVLLLQPILENSILYAFDEKEEKGLITISVREEEPYILITIRDNGKGFNYLEMDQLRDEKRSKYSSIGLKNVQERITLYYGHDCGMTIKSGNNQGTIVTIRIKDKLDKGGVV